MHSIVNRPMVVGGNIVPRPMMYIALTYDHRLIDGREAVFFLRRIKDVVEDPRRLLLDVWGNYLFATIGYGRQVCLSRCFFGWRVGMLYRTRGWIILKCILLNTRLLCCFWLGVLIKKKWNLSTQGESGIRLPFKNICSLFVFFEQIWEPVFGLTTFFVAKGN